MTTPDPDRLTILVSSGAEDAALLKRRPRLSEVGRAMLVERFPACFMPKGADKKPLKLGIYYDIRKAAPDIKARTLNITLRDYTEGHKYLLALSPGRERIDLEGKQAGFVSDEEARTATVRRAGLNAASEQFHEIRRLRELLRKARSHVQASTEYESSEADARALLADIDAALGPQP